MATHTTTVRSGSGEVASVSSPHVPAKNPVAASAGNTSTTSVDKGHAKGDTKQTNDGKGALDAAVKALNQSPQIVQRNLEFSVDKESGKVVVKIVDRKTGEVIRQIPSKETLALAQDLKKGAAHLFSAKA